MIPTTGPLVKLELTEPDPNNPGSTRRMMLPMDTIMWVKKEMEKLGVTMDKLAQLNPADLATMGDMLAQKTGQQMVPQQEPVLPPNMGNGIP